MSNFPKDLYKRFPVKYGKDHGDKKNIEEIVFELRNLIDHNASQEKLCDYLDEEFLFGAWGETCKDLSVYFLADLRSMIIQMYKIDKKNKFELMNDENSN